MAISCICPKCRKTLSISEQYANQTMKCPFCSAMFQSPTRTVMVAVEGSNPFADSATQPYTGPTPPWQAPAKDPHAPVWPWLVGQQQAPAGYDWQNVRGGEAVRLAPGWHMVLRGMALLPPSFLAVFITLVLGRLFVLLTNPDPESMKVVNLIVIPITLIASLGIVAGKIMCCLVPLESKLRPWALAAAASVFFGLVAGFISIYLLMVLHSPGWEDANPGKAGFVKFVMGLSYIVFVLLVGGAGILFLLFLRGIAMVFDDRRLAQHLLWYLVFFALSPAFALFVFFLFRGTATILVMNDPEVQGAVNIVYTAAEFVLAAVVLAGFLLMLRDTRTCILRAITAVKA